jgi:HK97 family phage major capsid protein
MTLEQLRAKAKELKEALAALFAKHKEADGKSFVADVPTEALAEIQAKQTEYDTVLAEIEKKEAEAQKLEDLQQKQVEADKKADALHARIVVRERPNAAPAQKAETPQSLSVKEAWEKYFDEHKCSPKDLVGKALELDVDVKTLMSTGAGWAPAQVRSDIVALSVQRALRLFDVLPVIEDFPAPDYRFMQETTHTNNAAERAESVQGTASPFAESAYALTEQSVALRMVGHHVPLTMEQLEDVPQSGAFAQNRLTYGAMKRFESQLISGNGTAPNIRGLLNTASIRTQAKGASTYDEVFALAIANVQANGEADPNVVIVHPTDYAKFRGSKSAVGEPIAGDPRESYFQPVYGLVPIVTTAITAGTALMLDSQYVDIVMRRGLIVEMTNSHADDFVNGIVRMRASVRGSIAVYRAPAVCQVTGL